ncbi:RuvC-like Holliday junction resolvase [Tsukamurella phage TPA2]|uniref:RuvC-like Holliday junction resolvase n=1 Tax=Tsukamurella phage TPA2 TaxID=981330 RepID=UPI0001FF8DA6|nr:RuvC-like Holliday junction resolvase [Tsukamurella phage TPA2]ADX31929.1 holliday junction resolvase [Tsukamurella phage TPA2]
MPIVVGVDPSLTATGLCVLNVAEPAFMDDPAPGYDARTLTVPSKSSKTWHDLYLRIHGVAQTINDAVDYADVIVMEQPAFASRTGKQHDRSWLWGEVYTRFADRNIPVLTARPQDRCLYATGKGNAKKEEVMAATIRRYTEIDIPNNNVADAVIFAALGARAKGSPIESDLAKKYLVFSSSGKSVLDGLES